MIATAPERVATYEEIRRYWDISEVEECSQWLDIRRDAEWLESERIRKQIK